jgi:membrane protein implicated in regulation of membrane protease activity
VRTAFDPVGQVYADGALWRARSADPGRRPAAGDRVRVEAVDGLTLTVHPEPEPEEPT